MQLINPSWTIWEQEPGLEGIYKQIERAARVCYKSEDKIAEGTAKKMVNNLIKSQHTAMLEHGTIYLKVPAGADVAGDFIDDVSTWTKFKLVVEPAGNWFAITTNYRRIIENHWEEYLKYLCEPTEYHEKRYTVRFICDRGVSHEIVRHRVFSFAMESTRYRTIAA